MKKFTDILLKIFAIGILVCLFAGALALVAYLAAFAVGGEIATEICVFTFKTYLPWVITATSVFTGIGLVGMYLSKQKALTAATEDVNHAEMPPSVQG